jgi:hypothetical protein
MSQQELGTVLAVTFQQVQKYENGKTVHWANASGHARRHSPPMTKLTTPGIQRAACPREMMQTKT